MAPFQKKSSTLLRETVAALANTNARIVVAQQRREAALLRDDVPTLDEIDGELAALGITARRQAERIRLLEAQAAREESDAVGRKRQELRERFARKLATADQKATELQAAVGTVVKLFREVIAIREDCRAAWPAGDSSTNAAAGALEGAALSGGAVRALLAFEFYRISADPFMGGVPGEQRNLSLPGAVSPRIDLQLTPDRIVPFADALRKASAFAVETMSTTLDPLRAVAGQAVAPLSDARSEAEVKLAALLKRQSELANDITPAGEAAYLAVVAEIANLSEVTS